MERRDKLVFFLILEEKLSDFTVEYDVSCTCVIYDFCWDMFPLYPLWEICFYHMDPDFCQMLFLYLLIWSCIFILFVNVMYHIVDLWILNHLCMSGINSTWLWFMIFLKILLDSVCYYFVEYFYINLQSRILAYYFPFLVFLSGLVSG